MLKWFARRILRDEISESLVKIAFLNNECIALKKTRSAHIQEIAADGERIIAQSVDIDILKDKIVTLEDRLKKRPSQTDIARANLRMFGQMAKIKDLADKNPAVLAGDILLILEGE